MLLVWRPATRYQSRQHLFHVTGQKSSKGFKFMKANIILRSLAVISLLAMLAACGGGPAGTGGGTQPQNPPTIRISSIATTVPANPTGLLPNLDLAITVQLTVLVRTAAGTAVPDGTIVNMTTNNAALGTLSIGDDPATTAIDEFLSQFTQIGTGTSGGNATFFFTSGALTGTAILTASSADPATGTNLTATININVTPVVDPQDRVTLTLTDSTLPTNAFLVAPFIGSPFLAEVGIQFRGADGQLTNPAGDEFAISIAPATTATYSTPDDPATDDINEFVLFSVNGPAPAAGGATSVFINSSTTPGTATLTVVGTDPVTNENFSNSVTVTVADGPANGVPASVSVPIPAIPIFVQGIGGNTLLTIDSMLLDGGGLPADDPADAGAFNNVLIALAPPQPNGSTLSGTNAAGVPVSGSNIAINTVNGFGSFAFTSGTTPGPHVITVTGDSADNNVDNGVQNPVSNTGTVIVGDGVLAGIVLVSDIFGGVTEVSDAVMTGTAPGTLMLPVGAIANDRFGAPVLPGTPLTFGKVDAPIMEVIPTTFVFSGFDANPAEGDVFFSVATNPGDGFLDDPTIIDEGVEIGDTVITFGDDVPDNSELESSRIVANVLNNTSLRVTDAFNINDPTGPVVNDGPAIPYVIGRSEAGTIGGSAVTGPDGSATVMLTYPGSVLGQPLVLWAQGTRPDGGETQTVADAATLVFPGQGPALISLSPSNVEGNGSSMVEICVTDANGFGLSNTEITFIVNGDFNFSVSGAPLVTGFDGCVTTTVTSSGIMSFDDGTTVTFLAAGSSADLLLTDPMLAELTVSPSALALPMGGDSGMVTVSVTGADGSAAGGAVITAECTTDVSIDATMGITDGTGTAPFVITADVDDVVGSCAFTTIVDGQFVGDTVGINAPGGGGIGVSPGPGG